MNLLEPEPKPATKGEETTRILWTPPLPDAEQARLVPKIRPITQPYLLAPAPWPRGQFRIDPEA